MSLLLSAGSIFSSNTAGGGTDTAFSYLGTSFDSGFGTTHDFTFTLNSAKTYVAHFAGRFDAATISSIAVVSDSPTITARQSLITVSGQMGVAIYELVGVAGGSQTIRMTLGSSKGNFSCYVYELGVDLSFVQAFQVTSTSGNTSGTNPASSQRIEWAPTTTAGSRLMGVSAVTTNVGTYAVESGGITIESQQHTSRSHASWSKATAAGGTETMRLNYSTGSVGHQGAGVEYA